MSARGVRRHVQPAGGCRFPASASPLSRFLLYPVASAPSASVHRPLPFPGTPSPRAPGTLRPRPPGSEVEAPPPPPRGPGPVARSPGLAFVVTPQATAQAGAPGLSLSAAAAAGPVAAMSAGARGAARQSPTPPRGRRPGSRAHPNAAFGVTSGPLGLGAAFPAAATRGQQRARRPPRKCSAAGVTPAPRMGNEGAGRPVPAAHPDELAGRWVPSGSRCLRAAFPCATPAGPGPGGGRRGPGGGAGRPAAARPGPRPSGRALPLRRRGPASPGGGRDAGARPLRLWGCPGVRRAGPNRRWAPGAGAGQARGLCSPTSRASRVSLTQFPTREGCVAPTPTSSPLSVG